MALFYVQLFSTAMLSPMRPPVDMRVAAPSMVAIPRQPSQDTSTFASSRAECLSNIASAPRVPWSPDSRAAPKGSKWARSANVPKNRMSSRQAVVDSMAFDGARLSDMRGSMTTKTANTPTATTQVKSTDNVAEKTADGIFAAGSGAFAGVAVLAVTVGAYFLTQGL